MKVMLMLLFRVWRRLIWCDSFGSSKTHLKIKKQISEAGRVKWEIYSLSGPHLAKIHKWQNGDSRWFLNHYSGIFVRLQNSIQSCLLCSFFSFVVFVYHVLLHFHPCALIYTVCAKWKWHAWAHLSNEILVVLVSHSLLNSYLMPSICLHIHRSCDFGDPLFFIIFFEVNI